MIRRRVLRWRFGVISVIGFLAVVSIPVALFYALREDAPRAGLPPPTQLAAIVRLAEEATDVERARAFEALRSAQFSVRIASDAEVETDLTRLWDENSEEIAV